MQSSGSEKSRFEKNKERRKLVVCEQMCLGQTVCWATAESLSTVSATTDSCSAGEAIASKFGAGEREGTGDGVEQKCTRAETGSTSH